MSNIYEDLGLDTKTVESAEAQEVSAFSVSKSGAYKAKIKSLCTFDTKSGAKMLQAIVHLIDEDKDITVYQNIIKKDGNPNQIGQATFKHILEATGCDIGSLTLKNEELKTYSYMSDCKVVQGLDNFVFLAGVRECFEDGADFEQTNEIEVFMKQDGTNSNGGNILDAFKAKIEKNPIKKIKSKNKVSTGGKASKETASDIDDLI